MESESLKKNSNAEEEEEKKKYHEFIWDADQILEYMTRIQTQSGVFVLQVCARNKYNTRKDTVQYKFRHGNARKLDILHNESPERVLKAIKSCQLEQGCYTDDEGKSLPGDCLVLYITDNPRNQAEAFQSFMESMTEAMRSHDNFRVFKNNFFRNVRGFVHGSLGAKNFLVLDVDDKDLENGVKKLIQEHKLNTIVTETHGGFHVLIENKSLTNVQRCAIVKFCEDNDSVTKDFNRSSPIPGTIQGGYKVKMRKDLMTINE